MKIKNLNLKNFLSFQDASLDLENKRLALILGRNNDTTSMDSNGSGKSVLLEGIVWGLFGRTFRGLRGDAVVNSTARRDCKVSLALSVNGSEIQITRYRKHTTDKDDLFMKIDGKEQKRMTPTETQALLEDTIHMDYETFMNTTVFPQGAFTYFASMADSDRKDLLESVMGMMPFDEYQRKARDKHKDIQSSIDKQTTDLTVIKSRIETERDRMADLTRRHAEFAAEKKDGLMLIYDKIQALKRKLENMERDISSLNLEETERAIDERRNSLENLEIDEDKRQCLISAVAEAQAKMSSLTIRINELSVELSGLEGLKPGQKCPLFKNIECKQMTGEDIKKYLDKIRIKIEKLSKQEDQAENERLASQRSLDVLNNQKAAYIQVEESVREDEIKLKNLQKQQVQLAPSKERISAEIRSTQRVYADLEKQPSPYMPMVEKSGKDLKVLAAEKKGLRSKIVSLEEKQKYIQFWVEGFSDRGLKSFLMDSVVQQLNERANHYLAYLTDGKVRIEISTRTRLKGGEEREKLDIKVYSKDGLQEYLGSSGGEKRRADLSMLLALRELAKARLEQTFDLLFVDEVFDVLDQSGIERVIHLLTQQTDDDVFVISHDASLMDAFENVITVEKTNGLSQII